MFDCNRRIDNVAKRWQLKLTGFQFYMINPTLSGCFNLRRTGTIYLCKVLFKTLFVSLIICFFMPRPQSYAERLISLLNYHRGSPGVSGNKGTKVKYRKEQENMTCLREHGNINYRKCPDWRPGRLFNFLRQEGRANVSFINF